MSFLKCYGADIYANDDIVTIIRELGECLRWSWIKFSICGASEIKGHVYPWLGKGKREGRKLLCLLIPHVLFLERSIEFETGCSNSHHRSSWQNPPLAVPCSTVSNALHSVINFVPSNVVISLWRIILLAKFPAPVKLVTQRTCKVWILEDRRKRDRRAQGGGTNGKSRLSAESRRMNEREKRRSSRPTSNHNLALCRVVLWCVGSEEAVENEFVRFGGLSCLRVSACVQRARAYFHG